jgi:hypothetical protein
MACTSLQGEGYATMTAAVEAMEAAIDTATEAIDAALQCNVVKISSASWDYWVLYT